MLTLTEKASSVISTLTDNPELPEGAGLRISSSPENPQNLDLSLSSGPDENDHVIEGAGARVFLEPNASVALDQMELDADVTEQGEVQFQLGPQAA